MSNVYSTGFRLLMFECFVFNYGVNVFLAFSIFSVQQVDQWLRQVPIVFEIIKDIEASGTFWKCLTKVYFLKRRNHIRNQMSSHRVQYLRKQCFSNFNRGIFITISVLIIRACQMIEGIKIWSAGDPNIFQLKIPILEDRN